MHNELQHIFSGESQIRYGENIQAVIRYLRAGEKSSTLAKSDKHFKSEETARLKIYIESLGFWKTDIDLNNYVSEGAEQKVYLKDSRSVVNL